MSEIQDQTIVQKKQLSPRPDATVVAGHAPPLSFDLAAPGSGVTVGTVLKRRFELTELLGAGGMGSVYRARDLRQVEAGDTKPWVAVKVINETFSRHEHALIALQQETKKTQRLAHPNIVSVYDFDREGDVAFMTMELLEGQSLDAVLARKPGGLPLNEALSVIRQICQAIEYAHNQGIVHADLKPANIFLTRDGRVKVLDFGIAQAMQADSHFDAQSLNALTPAYASVDMLCGERPQTVDDLYGLGCIFFLLLSGRHPFNRKRATEADAAQLKPPRIVTLKSLQWRALKRLLQFHPDGKTNIRDFQLDFFLERDTRLRRLSFGFALLAMLVTVSAMGIHNYLNRHLNQIAGAVGSLELSRVQEAVGEIHQLSGGDRVVVLEQARDSVAAALEQRIAALKTARDYQQLHASMVLISALYPDSSRIQDDIVRFDKQRRQFIQSLSDTLEQRIKVRDFTGTPSSFAQQLQALRVVSPNNALFSHYDLKVLLAREAGVAVYLGQRSRARDILAQADLLFPNDRAGFQRIRNRLGSRPAAEGKPVIVEHEQESEREREWQQAQSLLAQFDLSHHPEQLADFLKALAKSQSSLYFALMQGLQDFIEQQKQAGNGKAFTSLSQQLFGTVPELAAIKRQRIDTCQLRLANLGKQRGMRCRDQITRNQAGPELVVVKVSDLPAFAISRMEISVSEYKLFCTLDHRCPVYPHQSDNLPITGISPQQAERYARWLTSHTGYRYRLPTLAEWQAVARDDSGVSDQNCILVVNGRVIRGNRLRAVTEGYANSLGVLNIFGNAEEWVRQGSQLFAVGGGANVDIRQCNASYIDTKASDANAFRGFRLVRELSH